MQSALGTPLDFVVLRKAEEDYLKKRHDPLWSVEIHNRRTLPVYGVADAFVDGDALLSRDNSFSGNELMATLELGYMLRLANNNRGFAKRMLYVSRSGFFTTTEPLKNATQALALYSRATSAPGLPGKRRGIILLAASCGKPFPMRRRSAKCRW
jgi:hypothetical protein